MATFYLDHDIAAAILRWLLMLGYNVRTTVQEGRQRAGDEGQLVRAARLGRTFVTHNGRHFEVLQRAWRYWADVWEVDPPPIHRGILVVDQSAGLEEWTALQIDAFVRSSSPLVNRLYKLNRRGVWTPLG